MKIWKTIIQQRKVLRIVKRIVPEDMKADIEANKKLVLWSQNCS